MSKKIIEYVEGLLNNILSELDCYLYDIEYVKEGPNRVLRVFLDKTGGIFIEDCENVSRKLSAKLDEEEFIDENYILEVSSPGVNRRLRKEEHFIQNIGKKVELSLFGAIDNSKKMIGTLMAYSPDSIVLQKETGEAITIDFKKIGSVKIYFEF